MTTTNIQSLIRTIPDYPKPGIQFRDITTLLGHADGFGHTILQLKQAVSAYPIEMIAGIESRGFIIGSALAQLLGVGFVPIRKPGKLPAPTLSESYALEYGADQLEIHNDACQSGDKVLLVDDLIATGGTAEAAIKLLHQLDAEVVAAAFVINLPDLGGISRLQAMQINTHCLCAFDGD